MKDSVTVDGVTLEGVESLSIFLTDYGDPAVVSCYVSDGPSLGVLERAYLDKRGVEVSSRGETVRGCMGSISAARFAGDTVSCKFTIAPRSLHL